ncbi:solute carrier family 49 member 4 homolog [Penaeus monodon]|uniref:solute carrier family 49 member 4 homolog n=1 Tax=Penaeus monodon TaxID=6687 RepID=UPI0018A73289|nr:solute carrier family 49 member 4 homolog [Penaeus monodon]
MSMRFDKKYITGHIQYPYLNVSETSVTITPVKTEECGEFSVRVLFDLGFLWGTRWGAPLSESVGGVPGWGGPPGQQPTGADYVRRLRGPHCGPRSAVAAQRVVSSPCSWPGTRFDASPGPCPVYPPGALLPLRDREHAIRAAPPLLAVRVSPPGRTPAVAVMMGCSQLGSVGSYLEPFIVRVPGPGVTIEDLQNDIMRLLYIHAGFSGVLLLAVVVYFPSKPKIPPSVTSSCERLNFIPGVLACVRNKSLLLILASYAVSVARRWPGSRSSNTPCCRRGHVGGVAAVVSSSVSPVFAGRFNDRFPRQVRTTLICLMLLAAFSFYWFLLLSYGVLPVTKWQVYVSVSVGMASGMASIPLYYELGVDLSYPVPEILVSGLITASDNISSSLFLLIFLIPNVGYEWITYTLVLSCSLPVLLMLIVKVEKQQIGY